MTETESQISKFLKYRKFLIGLFGLLIIASMASVPFLKFSFSFEQFFPQGDEDLAFFQEFIKDFETDDNFLMIAVENEPTVFDSVFLNKFSDFSKDCRVLPYVTSAQSLTDFKFPIKTPFGMSSIKAIHLDDANALKRDAEKIMSDERFVYNLISPDTTAMVVFLKTEDQLDIEPSIELMNSIKQLNMAYGFDEYHVLGRAYFQSELSHMQKREVIVSTLIGALLVGLILSFIFRKPIPILIAFGSIGVGLVTFFGLLSLLGRELNAIAAFYPVLMLIVGTSDVIHIMSKYMDELRLGKDNDAAIVTTIREIGMATLLTSVTTAVGFLSLLTSRLIPIQQFGINSAMGVVLAFICTILFTCSVLSLVPKEKILYERKREDVWSNTLSRINTFTKENARLITILSLIFLVVSAFGISKISTNYNIVNNLPKNSKITDDFKYFEEEFAGFRPFEFAVSLKEGYNVDDFNVVSQIDKFDDYLKSIPSIRTVSSISSIYKSINQMFGGNKREAYAFPNSEKKFDQYQKLASKLPNQLSNTLISKDGTKTRVSARIRDIGADAIKELGEDIDNWIEKNLDLSIMSIRRTGTGLIMDKNSVYVRENLVHGLGLGLIIISLLMGLLFKSFRILLISLVPNILPMIFAAALIGYTGIKLEAVISIVFALIFGIAVDDSIHFLSKYKLAIEKTKDKEKALEITFRETGKAICFTTIVLFFGFLVMLFSIHPPSIVIGTLISVTLLSAVVADLYVLPVLIRKWM